MHFRRINDISTWSVRSYQKRYCPLTGRQYLVCTHYQPAILLDEDNYTTFVN